jgi:hypothetical protein
MELHVENLPKQFMLAVKQYRVMAPLVEWQMAAGKSYNN